MSRHDDETAALFGAPPSKLRRPTSRTLIVQPATLAISGNASIAISASGTLTVAGQAPTVNIELDGVWPQESDPISSYCDRWLKFLLPRHFYTKVVEQIIADWQHEHHEGEAGAWWITLKNFGYLAWVLAKWPFVAAVINWLLPKG